MSSHPGCHVSPRVFAGRVSRISTNAVIGAALLAPLAAAAAEESLLALEEAVRMAVHRAPLLTADEATARAAREMAVAAGQRPDPVLKFGVSNVPIDGPVRFDLNRDFMTMSSIGVMQELTAQPKLDARAVLATRSAELAAATRDARATQVERETALAWLERSFQQSRRELLLRQLAEAQLLLPAAELAYRIGDGPQADLFAARAEVERLRDRVSATDASIATATAELARWIGDAAAGRALAPRPLLDRVPFDEPGAEAHVAHHTSIAVVRLKERLAAAAVELAQRDRDSDWNVELMYSRRGTAYTDMVSINFALPMQWNQAQRQDRELAAHVALREAAQARLEDELRLHTSEARALRQEWESLRERLSRYDRALLPLTRQRCQAVLTAYRAGTNGLGLLLQARGMVLDTEIERLMLEKDAARTWARLHTLIGFDVATPAPSAESRAESDEAPITTSDSE